MYLKLRCFFFSFEFILQLNILLKHPKPSEHLVKHHCLCEHIPGAEPWHARAECSEQVRSHGIIRTKWVCFNTKTRKCFLKAHKEQVSPIQSLQCWVWMFSFVPLTHFLARAVQSISAARRCFEFLTQQLISSRALQNAFNIWTTRDWASNRTILTHWKKPLPLGESCCPPKHQGWKGFGTRSGEEKKKTKETQGLLVAVILA